MSDSSRQRSLEANLCAMGRLDFGGWSDRLSDLSQRSQERVLFMYCIIVIHKSASEDHLMDLN
jgi:hypothetical protein